MYSVTSAGVAGSSSTRCTASRKRRNPLSGSSTTAPPWGSRVASTRSLSDTDAGISHVGNRRMWATTSRAIHPSHGEGLAQRSGSTPAISASKASARLRNLSAVSVTGSSFAGCVDDVECGELAEHGDQARHRQRRRPDHVQVEPAPTKDAEPNNLVDDQRRGGHDHEHGGHVHSGGHNRQRGQLAGRPATLPPPAARAGRGPP